MNKNKLAKILNKHIKWLNDENGGERANLNGADLNYANLRGADLRYANLNDTNLSYAELRGIDLYYANLHSANLYNTDLSDADLWCANLYGADLRAADLHNANLCDINLQCASLCRANLRDVNLYNANLYSANLRETYLYGAYLYHANLYRADLRGAILYNANLRGANLCNADLSGANLRDATLRDTDLGNTLDVNIIPIACPDTGAFVGWKKCRAHGEANELLIVKLLIPEDAKRSSAVGRKCRASKAIVLDVQDANGNSVDKSVYSIWQADTNFEYCKGKTVEPQQPFDEDRWNECASGIHFFITRQEAIDYQC